jgi:hypothetical protein
MAAQVFTAIEAQSQVRKAIKDWREKFANGAENLEGLGGTILWHPRLRMWGHFSSSPDGYWNPFGFSTARFRQNMIVEINPPPNGRSKQRQGVLARSDDGSRWVLHKGRMSIPKTHISEAQFDKATSSERRRVTFSDGGVIECHPVANIDADAIELQNQITRFVTECNRIRLHYALDSKVAEQEATVEAAENGPPELTDSYEVPAQNSRVAFRQHGEVWNALTTALVEIGVKHTNGRVGRWGPDLRTVGERAVLFEIKVTNDASDVQRAVGQLLLYEQLLGATYRKVLVLPEALREPLGRAARELGIEVLLFTRKSKKVIFEKGHLSRLTAD